MDDVTTGRRSVALDPDALATLEEQRGFLRRSIADLELEHDAGDLDDDDHATLRADYEQRLAAVETAIADGRAVFAAARSTNPRRTAVIVAAVVLFALACGIGVANVAGRRGVGDEISGDLPETARGQLSECYSAWFGANDLDEAERCFQRVSASDPTNLEAKTYASAVPVMRDESSSPDYYGLLLPLIEVTQADPTYGDVHAFLAVAWLKLGEPDNAVKELERLAGLQHSAVAAQFADTVRSSLDRMAPTTTTAATTPPP